MPKLVFIEDKSFDHASNISQKIKGLNLSIIDILKNIILFTGIIT